MHLFYQPESVPFLSEDDSRHAIKTLRLNTGDVIAITDGHGNCHTAVITQADARRCGFRITDTQTTPVRPFSIRICVAPTKNLDRIEWFVEKSVEIGIERISFFFGQHSERRVLKLERLEKIAIAAMKQSLQSYLPQLDEAVSFRELLKTIDEEQRFIAHLPANEPPVNLAKVATATGRYAILIGPEGDFSESEIQQAVAAGFQMVTLGPNRLRTETAALTACQLLNFIKHMKKLLLTLLIIHCSLFVAQAQYAYKIAKLKYGGGGDWYANKTSLPNLIKFANANLRMNIFPEEDIVEAGSPDIFGYPFVHMTGHGNVTFNDAEVQNLRRYLMSGGFLHIDDNYGLDKFIRREMKKVFPELNFIELPFNHPVYQQKF